jgi:hypothetical protein
MVQEANTMTPESGRAPKANFFLVGAPKAGTTSLDRLLRRHADVFLSPIKEPCHFCPDVNEPSLNRKDRLDVSSYLALAADERPIVHLRRVASTEDYARLFEGAAGRHVVGECSTYYLSSEVAAGRIHAYNPDAKIMVLVRRPVDRIRSHYAMDRLQGVASRPLLDLIREELALGDEANWGNCRYYVGASRYSTQIARFRRFFPPQNICVLSFERLVSEPAVELRRAFDFLGIAPPEPLELPLENKSRAARFPLLHAGLRHSGLKPLINGLLDRGVGARLGQAAKSVYYREKFRVASGDELDALRELLRKEGLDGPIADAA